MIVLFDNYDGYDFETIKEELEELNGIAPTEQDVYYLIAIREEKDWKETKELLEQIDSCFGFIIKGHAGLWTGKHECMDRYYTMEEMLQAILKDCDYVKIWSDDGHLFIKASHHDGTHEFEIKLITDKGYNVLEEWEDGEIDMTCYEMYNNLWENEEYTELPRIEKELWNA